MIIIQCPLKREYIIDLLDQRKEDNQTFIFKKQENMKLYFEVEGDQEKAMKNIKRIIKQSKYGSALYFIVTYE